MTNFDKPAEEQPDLVRAQWFGDGGVGRGVDPEVARDIGYRDPSEPEIPEDQDSLKPGQVPTKEQRAVIATEASAELDEIIKLNAAERAATEQSDSTDQAA